MTFLANTFYLSSRKRAAELSERNYYEGIIYGKSYGKTLTLLDACYTTIECSEN